MNLTILRTLHSPVDLNNLEEFKEQGDVALREKVRQLAGLFKDAKRVIVFTGAGISTSASIPDFRGPNGVWTRQAQGRAAPKGVSLVQAVPTYTHMALAALLSRGAVRHIVSQNVDGLHRRSGVARDALSELHGNCYLEQCWVS